MLKWFFNYISSFREKNNYGKIHIGKFYLRRILRIWPLYYAIIIFGFIVFPYLRNYVYQDAYIETATFWKYVFFLGNFDQIENGFPRGAGLTVTWSLSVEEQFYLIWPLFLAFIKPKYYLVFVFSIFITSNILMHFFNLPYSHTFGSMSDLSIGALLALVSYKKKNWFIWLTNISKSCILIIYIIGISVICLWSLFDIGNRIFVSLFMIYVIFEQSFCKHSIIKMKEFKKLSYLGTLTYGLYLLHGISNAIVFQIIKLSDVNILPFTEFIVQFVFSLILTLILGYLSYNYFEKPFLNLKRKFTIINTSSN